MSLLLTNAGSGSGGGPPPWSPADLSDLSLWLTAGPSWCFQDAAKTVPCGDGDPVYTWADRSGNGYDLVQSTLGNRPKLVSVSGKWVVLYDGSDDAMSVTVPASPLVADRWVGLQLTNTTTAETRVPVVQGYAFGSQNTAQTWNIVHEGRAWSSSASSAGDIGVSRVMRHLVTAVGESTLYRDGASICTLSTGAPLSNLTIVTFQYGPVRIAGVVATQTAVSVPEETEVTDYLTGLLP